MRCHDCGTVWFSAVAEQAVATWGRCVRCRGALHVERRRTERRRIAQAA
jgi:hypothetical protein